MENLDIRLLIHEKGLSFKEIASVVGVSRVYLSRIMSRPLTARHRERILAAIQVLEERKVIAHE